jgi:cystathionine gamma-synthase
VSVSLPTWKANVGYEEGEQWVVSRMTTGYPRYVPSNPPGHMCLLTVISFFVHKCITAFAKDVVNKHGQPGQQAMIFPSSQAAQRCATFIERNASILPDSSLSLLDFSLDLTKDLSPFLTSLAPTISAVVCSPENYLLAKQYWQHTGDGVSSRRAEFCHGLFKEGLMTICPRPNSPTGSHGKACRGPRRYQRPASISESTPPNVRQSSKTPNLPANNGIIANFETQESSRFLEERFGRNLDLSFVEQAKSAIKRRIAGAMTSEVDSNANSNPDIELNSRGIGNLREDDVYLYPCGMNAIFNAHRALLRARGDAKSINFSFPYVDTLKILQKFGPGCIFYGHASAEDLDNLEVRLKRGERFLALFCEFPSNPLLTCPDLPRIRQLSREFDFAVVVDETIGTFANINVLQFADIVVSSLTKIFSGDCNVMGGSAILNPNSPYYGNLKTAMVNVFEDTYWPEDVIFMERNSRDFMGRIDRINTNAEAICGVLHSSPLVKRVYYPKYNSSRPNYEACKLPTGGFGGLLSVTFHTHTHAIAFYDAIATAKGPSLGTNFTLTSPYVLLAHYQELEWAASFGVEPDLLRVSVGLEETEKLMTIFSEALQSCQ